MSLISFLKDAGEKLIHPGQSQPATAAPPATAPDAQSLNKSAGEAIERYIASQNLSAQDLAVQFDANTQTVTVSGVVSEQASREKIVLCCGNVQGVARVNDQLKVVGTAPALEARYHTVQSGDTLSKIAKDVYDNASAYLKIFEANKPMLSDPNKIYPGQKLRVPAV